MENDDPSAELAMQAQLGSGLTPADLCPWNIAPWYVNRAPRAVELDEGGDVLLRLLANLPRVQVVVLHGGDAQHGWRRLSKRRLADMSRHRTAETFHTSAQAFISPDPAVRAARRQHVVDSYTQVHSWVS